MEGPTVLIEGTTAFMGKELVLRSGEGEFLHLMESKRKEIAFWGENERRLTSWQRKLLWGIAIVVVVAIIAVAVATGAAAYAAPVVVKVLIGSGATVVATTTIGGVWAAAQTGGLLVAGGLAALSLIYKGFDHFLSHRLRFVILNCFCANGVVGGKCQACVDGAMFDVTHGSC